jgi:hypothetical protein
MASSAAKAAGSTKMKEKPFSFFKGVCVPLIGFGVGWGGYSLVEQYQLVDPSTTRWTHIYNLKLQRMVQQQLPEVLAQRMSFSKEQLDAMIGYLEAGGADQSSKEAERVPFKKILADCRPQEQLEWLSDHISEDIPYFFIADIFHSWAELHEDAFLRGEPETLAALRGESSAVFDSKVLSQGVWKKMMTEVIPFDVGVRVLCVLARRGQHNAKWINALHGAPDEKAVDTVLRLHKEYKEQLIQSHQGEGNVVPSRTVDAATAVLVAALNDAAVHGRRFPWIGRSPSGPFPLLNTSRRDTWCNQLGHIALADLATDRVAHITEAHYQCAK